MFIRLKNQLCYWHTNCIFFNSICLFLLIVLYGLVNLIDQFLFSDSRVTLLELMMVNVCEKNLHTSEEMHVLMRHADFLAGCFQEKYEAVLKLTSAEDADDEVCTL